MKQYIELLQDGLTMRGYHHITGSSEIVIMFHGFTGNKSETSYMFKKLSAALELRQIDSIRFDYFGSGESDGLFSDMTLDVLLEQANTILSHVRGLEYAKIHLLGFSMGGALTMNLLEHADKTILIAPAIEFYKHDSSRNTLNMLDNGNYAYNCFELNTNLFRSFKKDYTLFATQHDNPVLIVQGKQDAAVGYQAVEALSQSFSNCQIELLETGNHIFNTLALYDVLEHSVLQFLTNK